MGACPGNPLKEPASLDQGPVDVPPFLRFVAAGGRSGGRRSGGYTPWGPCRRTIRRRATPSGASSSSSTLISDLSVALHRPSSRRGRPRGRGRAAPCLRAARDRPVGAVAVVGRSPRGDRAHPRLLRRGKPSSDRSDAPGAVPLVHRAGAGRPADHRFLIEDLPAELPSTGTPAAGSASSRPCASRSPWAVSPPGRPGIQHTCARSATGPTRWSSSSRWSRRSSPTRSSADATSGACRRARRA